MAQHHRPILKRSRRKRLDDAICYLLDVLKTGGDFRAAKVRRLRAAVRARRYENDLKLSVAVDRMLSEAGV